MFIDHATKKIRFLGRFLDLNFCKLFRSLAQVIIGCAGSLNPPILGGRGQIGPYRAAVDRRESISTEIADLAERNLEGAVSK
jgi:hypothetical protein